MIRNILVVIVVNLTKYYSLEFFKIVYYLANIFHLSLYSERHWLMIRCELAFGASLKG